MSVEDVFSAVVRQAKDVVQYCASGRMLAILHDTGFYDKEPILYENSELAGINLNSHFIVSGAHDKIQLIASFLQKKGISHFLLPVSYGFHSSVIDPAEPSYTTFLQQQYLREPLKILFLAETIFLTKNILSFEFFE